jgi:hypothetical protein
MLKNIFTLILAFCLSSIFAQDKFLSIKQVSTYSQSDRYIPDRNVQSSSNFSNKASRLDLGLYSIGIQRIKDRKLQEFSVMPMNFSYSSYETSYKDSIQHQIVDGGRLSNYSFFTDYKYSYILREQSKKFLPFAGLGAMFYYQYEKYSPRVSNMFVRDVHDLEFNLLANIGFLYRISDQLYFSMQIPFILYQFNVCFDKESNPLLRVSDLTTTTTEHNLLPNKYFLMMGFSYKYASK